jgi:hypothetical protein
MTGHAEVNNVPDEPTSSTVINQALINKQGKSLLYC